MTDFPEIAGAIAGRAILAALRRAPGRDPPARWPGQTGGGSAPRGPPPAPPAPAARPRLPAGRQDAPAAGLERRQPAVDRAAKLGRPAAFSPAPHPLRRVDRAVA